MAPKKSSTSKNAPDKALAEKLGQAERVRPTSSANVSARPEDGYQDREAKKKNYAAAESDLAAKLESEADNASTPAHAEQPASYAITQEVEGQEHDLLVTSGHVDPIQLKPGKRDTLEKDTNLQEHGEAQTDEQRDAGA